MLHSQLEAGQLGHERLVTHMERIRDGELQTERGAVKDGGECLEDKGREGLIERRGGDGGRGGRKHCEHTESNNRSST